MNWRQKWKLPLYHLEIENHLEMNYYVAKWYRSHIKAVKLYV